MNFTPVTPFAALTAAVSSATTAASDAASAASQAQSDVTTISSTVDGINTTVGTVTSDLATLTSSVESAASSYYSASNPPPAPPFPKTVPVSGIYEVVSLDFNVFMADSLDGKLICFVKSTPGTSTVTLPFLASPSDGAVFRFMSLINVAISPADTISISDGANTVVTLSPGEAVHLQWFADANNSGTQAQWLKISGF